MRVTTRQIAPGMIQQMQHVCPECGGSGEVISDRDRCPQCKGNKVAQEKKVLEVNVEIGMHHNQKITFEGEADQAPDTVTGDIVFIIQQKEHPKFKRKFDDLYVEHTLTLTEALCGFQFVLTHLDGRQLLIKSNPGEVIKPDHYKAINDEGMPNFGKPFIKGRLYIHFDVVFPESGVLSPDTCRAMETILPSRQGNSSSETELNECEETIMHNVNIEEEMRRKEQRRQQEAYDSDGDEPRMHRMACNQQ